MERRGNYSDKERMRQTKEKERLSKENKKVLREKLREAIQNSNQIAIGCKGIILWL